MLCGVKNMANKEKENKGIVVWITGLSGSGKTTIALKLKAKLEALDKSVIIIDGDEIRSDKHKHLSFSRQDVKKNNRLTARLAKDKSKSHDFVLVPIISPYAEDRKMVKEIIGQNHIELFTNSSLENCIKRDVKGLYKKALAGEIEDFIGISKTSPYETPKKPDLEIKTDNMSIEKSVDKAINYLKKRKFL